MIFHYKKIFMKNMKKEFQLKNINKFNQILMIKINNNKNKQNHNNVIVLWYQINLWIEMIKIQKHM